MPPQHPPYFRDSDSNISSSIKNRTFINNNVTRDSHPQALSQNQGQVLESTKQNLKNVDNQHLVNQILSIMNSSMESNSASTMMGGGNNNHVSQMTISNNANTSTPGAALTVGNNNVNMTLNNSSNNDHSNSNGNLNANGNSGGSNSVVTQGGPNAVMNFPLLNPNIYRHLPYDATTAALLMNPQAAAHAAAAAQAAVASVAQQFVNAQQQQSQQQQQPSQPPQPQPNQQQTQQHHHSIQPHQQQPSQTQQRRLPTQAGPSHPNKVQSPSTNVILNGNYSLNNMNNNSNVTNSMSANVAVNAMHNSSSMNNLNAQVTSHENSNKNNISTNNNQVNAALAVLSKAGLINSSNINQATAQAVAAAAVAASGIKIQPPPPAHVQHNTAPILSQLQHPHTINHNHTAQGQGHASVVGVGVNQTASKKKRIVQSALPTMPPPSKSPLGIQSMMTTMQGLRPGATKSTMLPVATNPLLGSPLGNMRNWTLPQLEAHVRLLREANQPIPQPLNLLLADARRKEEKRTAKRVANRKSACTSRARKKALVEEMTRTNAKLKRQALILSLLPDLVVAITVDGEITFCSAQVERVLRHSVHDLVGSNLYDILLPASKEALQRLIGVLLRAEANELNSQNNRNKSDDNGGSFSSSVSSNDVAIVSEQSFPLSVVKVMGPESKASNGSNNTRSGSGDKGKNIGIQSNSSLGNSSSQSGSDEDRNASQTLNNSNEPSPVSQPGGNNTCDDSSSEAKMRASESLNRNVQQHKDQLSKEKQERANAKHKDDVTGASVTANNADAKLSSLQHCPKKGKLSRPKTEKKPTTKKNSMHYENMDEQLSSASSDSLLSGVEEKPVVKSNNTTSQQRTRNSNENESDDSGYRVGSESFPSREDSGSSTDDSSTNQRNGRRPKPLAPTCNVCLIRDDLSTIWCEVTSSIRTRSLSDEAADTQVSNNVATKPNPSNATSAETVVSNYGTSENKTENAQADSSVKELLLCLRPIREGEEKVTEELRFKPRAQVTPDNTALSKHPSDKVKKLADSSGTSALNLNLSQGVVPLIKRPVKKRPFSETNTPKADTSSSNKLQKESQSGAKQKNGSGPHRESEATATEKSVVESLMLMLHKTNRNDN